MTAEPGAATRRELLAGLYGPGRAAGVADQVEGLLARYRRRPRPGTLWNQRDAWLITYPDQFHRPGQAPLVTLRDVFAARLEPWLTGLHVLPFFPWSSDDGFAVTDYLAVDERYGTWQDVAALADGRRLVVDAVINHLSASSRWFRRFLAGDPAYAGFFRTADPGADLSAVVRPRVHPLLTRFARADGPVWVWTTFSPDQVDLDYRTPAVLLRVLEVLLTYVERGASVLRLDAVAFLWKQEGTTCIHLPQTHLLIRFLRSCIDAVDPSVLVLTETNVRHEENVAYFGPPGVAEAHLVYQFTLPPLVLHALATGDASRLRGWLAALDPPRPGTTFLNFLASHDGVGMRPAEGLLGPDEVDRLVDLTARAGGVVSSRSLPGGRTATYELNATWYALMAAGAGEEDGLRRHLAAHAVMLALQGIPAIYVHSLVASDNDREAHARSGQPRALNRARFDDVDRLLRALTDPATRAGAAWQGLRRMLAWRAATPAFDPGSGQRLIDGPDAVLAVERRATSGGRARVLVNMGRDPVTMPRPGRGWVDCRTGEPPGPTVELPGWSSVWLRTDDLRRR